MVDRDSGRLALFLFVKKKIPRRCSASFVAGSPGLAWALQWVDSVSSSSLRVSGLGFRP